LWESTNSESRYPLAASWFDEIDPDSPIMSRETKHIVPMWIDLRQK